MQGYTHRQQRCTTVAEFWSSRGGVRGLSWTALRIGKPVQPYSRETLHTLHSTARTHCTQQPAVLHEPQCYNSLQCYISHSAMYAAVLCKPHLGAIIKPAAACACALPCLGRHSCGATSGGDKALFRSEAIQLMCSVALMPAVGLQGDSDGLSLPMLPLLGSLSSPEAPRMRSSSDTSSSNAAMVPVSATTPPSATRAQAQAGRSVCAPAMSL